MSGYRQRRGGSAPKAALLFLVCLPAAARGDGLISGKISLTGMYYVEQEQLGAGEERQVLAAPGQLGFGDLRAVLYGRGLARDHLDFRFDMRVRATGSFDYERKFDPQPLAASPQVLSARGYLGGPEYDLREANLTLRFGTRGALQAGRMFVLEADMIKVDALRATLLPSANWTLSVFGGGLPNPYSRSLLTDYEPPCGSGVAAGDTTINLPNPLAPTPAAVPAATGACQTEGSQFAFVGGLTAAYRYERLWGNLGLVGTFVNGVGDGGPVVVDAARSNTVGNLLSQNGERDASRIFLSSNTHVNPTDRIDLFANLVIDFFGSSGPQLTRALVTGILRALSGDRLTLRMTYAHHSALAMNMFLNRQLYNRASNGTTLAGLGVVENNLTVLRTGRDEVRLFGEIKALRKLSAYVEGRFRYRTLLGAETNSSAYENDLYADQTRSYAGDLSLGLRDGGSLAGIRALLSYMFLGDFRAHSHVMRLALGRSFLGDRLSLDADYTAVVTRDAGAGGSSCDVNQFPSVGAAPVYQLNTATSLFLADCYGRRQGQTHEIGATVTANPWRRLFFLVDYRFTALLTEPQGDTAVPTVLAHTALVRAELGF